MTVDFFLAGKIFQVPYSEIPGVQKYSGAQACSSLSKLKPNGPCGKIVMLSSGLQIFIPDTSLSYDDSIAKRITFENPIGQGNIGSETSQIITSTSTKPT